MEFDRDWSPFDDMLGDHHCFKNSENLSVDDGETGSVNSLETDDNEASDDGISATWEGPIRDEIEDGEIVEETYQNKGVAKSPASKQVVPLVDMPIRVSPVVEKCNDALMEKVVSSPIFKFNSGTEVFLNVVDPIPGNLVTPNVDLAQVNKSVPILAHEPIPNIKLPGGDDWPISPDLIIGSPKSPLFGKGESLDKRRRILNANTRTTLVLLQRSLDFDAWPPLPSSSGPSVVRFHASTPIHDLNKSVSHNDPTSNCSNHDEDTSSNEISSILKVGNDVGFQITREDHVVQEVVSKGVGVEDNNQ